ncbi:MAG: Maf family protein, partial [Lachnospiraceae bacterium]|nr:Maf family protein [Lachnospiraceae bacterium]
MPNIILASKSPRRYELLRQIGITPVVLPGDVEERMEGETPEEIVMGLSRQKAEDIAGTFSNGELVIGADTVVAVDHKILGKPATHEEAAQMIRGLSGRTHQVYTGVTLVKCGPGGHVMKTCCAKTDVHVSSMTEEEILMYAESDEPMDKAGAYGIQGPFAAFVEGIDGEYANVVGLPVALVYREIKGF